MDVQMKQMPTVFCRHSKHQIIHLMFINSRLNLFKNGQIFLHFFAVWFFFSEEDTKYLISFAFVFHKFIMSFWFISRPNKHQQHKQTCSEFIKVVWFFLGKEDTNYLIVFVFVFNKFITSFWFLWPNKHHWHKQTRSESAKLMFLNSLVAGLRYIRTSISA